MFVVSKVVTVTGGGNAIGIVKVLRERAGALTIFVAPVRCGCRIV